MPRYIDADAFIVDSIKNKRFVIQSEDFKNDSIIVETVYGDLLDAINSMPTVDAVEVVRCRDCVRWGTGHVFETECIKECQYGHYLVGENGYCVYGERKLAAEVEG